MAQTTPEPKSYGYTAGTEERSFHASRGAFDSVSGGSLAPPLLTTTSSYGSHHGGGADVEKTRRLLVTTYQSNENNNVKQTPQRRDLNTVMDQDAASEEELFV